MIKELSLGQWSYVPIAENPADQGTRANKPEQLTELWLKGPEWLTEGPTPQQPEILETEESNKERSKKERAMIAQDSQPEAGFGEEMAARHSYWRLMRLTGWIMRFKNNVLGNGHKTKGPPDDGGIFKGGTHMDQAGTTTFKGCGDKGCGDNHR